MTTSLLTIEGLMGAGKSTLMSILKVRFPCALFIEEWFDPENELDRLLLQYFYDEPSKYAYRLQTHVLSQMAQQMYAAAEKQPELVIMDRSPWSAFLFVKNAHDAGYLSEREFTLLVEQFDNLIRMMERDLLFSETHQLYLKCDPALALERMHSRGRNAECRVGLSYLERLQDLHTGWLGSGNNVIETEATLNLRDNVAAQDALEARIRETFMLS